MKYLSSQMFDILNKKIVIFEIAKKAEIEAKPRYQKLFIMMVYIPNQAEYIVNRH